MKKWNHWYEGMHSGPRTVDEHQVQHWVAHPGDSEWVLYVDLPDLKVGRADDGRWIILWPQD